MVKYPGCRKEVSNALYHNLKNTKKHNKAATSRCFHNIRPYRRRTIQNTNRNENQPNKLRNQRKRLRKHDKHTFKVKCHRTKTPNLHMPKMRQLPTHNLHMPNHKTHVPKMRRKLEQPNNLHV